MSTAKIKSALKTGLMIFGGVVTAAIIIRSSKAAKETGQKVTDAIAADFKQTTKFS